MAAFAPDFRRRLSWGPVVVGGATIAGDTALAAVLECYVGLADASIVYLPAVVAVAGLYGMWPAVVASVAALLVCDFLLTVPQFTLAMSDPQEWLSLVLFFLVAVVVGRLAAVQGGRSKEAEQRALEAQTLFAISRSLATSVSIAEAAQEIVARLRAATDAQRVWIAIGAGPGQERVIADSAGDAPRPDTPVAWVLHRRPGDEPAEWVKTHGEGGRRPTAARPRRESSDASGDVAYFRAVVESLGRTVGSVWAARDRAAGLPDRSTTRIVSLAADQLGLALRREELAGQATGAEVARRSDALKSALLDSVSHDLRTPLATIRALAGGLVDEAVHPEPAAIRKAAASIDEEASRLAGIVRNILDLSRIEGGAIRSELEVHELGDLVGSAIERREVLLSGHPVSIDVPPSLPPVLVDAVFLDQAIGNVLENSVRYAGADSPIRITAALAPNGQGVEQGVEKVVELLIEDAGPGVPDAELARLFEKFFRRSESRGGSRTGLGIGLSVARGLVEAMGGGVTAERASLGGLAIRIRLRVAQPGATTPTASSPDVTAPRPPEGPVSVAR